MLVALKLGREQAGSAKRDHRRPALDIGQIRRSKIKQQLDPRIGEDGEALTVGSGLSAQVAGDPGSEIGGRRSSPGLASLIHCDAVDECRFLQDRAPTACYRPAIATGDFRCLPDR